MTAALGSPFDVSGAAHVPNSAFRSARGALADLGSPQQAVTLLRLEGITASAVHRAAALATVTLAMDPALLDSVRTKGEHFQAGLRDLQSQLPEQVVDVRGQGLLVGVELAADAGPVLGRMREQGVLCNLAGERTLRFAPPYIVTLEELDLGVLTLKRALSAGAPSDFRPAI